MRRIKRTAFLILCLLFLAAYYFVHRVVEYVKSVPSPEMVSPNDRILILAPHPDDEVLACAGVIQDAVAKKVPLRVVFFTYGDNNEWSFLLYRKHPVFIPKAAQNMGQLRRDEAIEAGKSLGVAADNLIFLGYPDFLTLNMWYSSWGDRPATAGMLTHVSRVPYANAYRPGAPYKGEEVVADLKNIIRLLRPTKIFVSHPSDHNADHRALYLFLRVALWDLEKELKPAVYPYLIHYTKWPKPAGYHPEEGLDSPKLFENSIFWLRPSLDSAAIKHKIEAIKKHVSQYNSSPQYLLSFVRTNELFGDFPDANLSSGASDRVLSLRKEKVTGDLPEQLLDIQNVTFVGVQERYARLEGRNLVLTIKLSRPLSRGVGASIYLFGYASQQPFASMPKIHIRFGQRGYKIYDQNRLLPRSLINVKRLGKEITITVPLEVLGNPTRILTSGHTYFFGVVPLDWVSWRVLEIKP